MIKTIDTGGICWAEPFRGSKDWLYGTDHTDGDLYEAEELYQDGHPITKNRLIFIRRADGLVREPLKAKDGQYFGAPLFEDGRIMILLADFPEEQLLLYAYDGDRDELQLIAAFPRSIAEDCYNLMPSGSPLMLTRQAGNRFQILWPEKADFAIAPSESFCFREEGRLYFSRWYEDPDYREEVIVRDLSGEILEKYPGTLEILPDGQKWLLV